MAYSASAIANFFIKRSLEDGSPLNLMKLNKLIYVAHGYNLAIFDNNLINEAVEAWKYGPVVSSIYHELKHFGMRPLEELLIEDGNIVQVNFSDKETFELLNSVWLMYKKYTDVQLSNWTHLPGSPWYTVWKLNNERIINAHIPDQTIKGYFNMLMEEARNAKGNKKPTEE